MTAAAALFVVRKDIHLEREPVHRVHTVDSSRCMSSVWEVDPGGNSGIPTSIVRTVCGHSERARDPRPQAYLALAAVQRHRQRGGVDIIQNMHGMT